jgi:CHAT domain/Ternary complex associated domain 7
MDLEQLTQSDFVLLHADWTTDAARGLVRELPASHVIVLRTHGDDDLYYLYDRNETLDRLAGGGTVEDALDLHEWSVAPLVEISTPVEQPPGRCIVHDQGRLVGFVDSVQPGDEAESPGGGGTGGGGTRGGGTRGGGTRGGGTRGGPPPLPPPAAPPPAAEPPEAPPPAEESGAGTAERFLVAEFPASVPLHETGSLLVSITSEMLTNPNALPLRVPLGSTMTVVVAASRGFVVEGPSEAALTVGEGDALPHRFVFRATEAGTGEIRVLAFVGAQPLGMLTLTAAIGAAAAPVDGRRRTRTAPLAEVVVTEPDLTLLILEGRDNGRTVLTMRLTASDPGENLYLKLFEPVQLRVDPAVYFADLFDDIDGLDLRTADARQIADERLAAKGATLFTTVFPVDLQRELWRLRDRITSVQILSEEPWIPWEICRLSGEDDTGRLQEGPFLCEAFALTRWLPGIPRRLRLTLDNMAVVVPADSGLAFAAQEWQYLQSLAKDGRAVKRIDAGFVEVRRELASGVYDGWHFSGHGAARSKDPNRSAIYLNNKQAFTPEELGGVVRNLGRAKPLVFLNACQVGRSGMSLTDIGGWARQFLYAGASGFVGAYWSVYDQAALNFAKALYDRLLDGVPIGRATQEARVEVKSDGDPTWLAYTVFADPLAAVET